MTIPDNMSRVTVRGKFARLNGSPMQGQISFTPSERFIKNRSARVMITSAVFTADLNADGYFEIELPATDDPDLDPTNFTYVVREPTGRVYRVDVPLNATGGVLDLIHMSGRPL